MSSDGRAVWVMSQLNPIGKDDNVRALMIFFDKAHNNKGMWKPHCRVPGIPNHQPSLSPLGGALWKEVFPYPLKRSLSYPRRQSHNEIIFPYTRDLYYTSSYNVQKYYNRDILNPILTLSYIQCVMRTAVYLLKEETFIYFRNNSFKDFLELNHLMNKHPTVSFLSHSAPKIRWKFSRNCRLWHLLPP